MKRRKRIIASILAAAFLIGGTTCYAGRVGATLYNDQTNVKTAILGNTTGTYRFTCTNSKLSKYGVEAYMYVGGSSANLTTVAKRYGLPANSNAYSQDIKVKKTLYTVSRVHMYGNIIQNPLTECSASTLLSNQ